MLISTGGLDGFGEFSAVADVYNFTSKLWSSYSNALSVARTGLLAVAVRDSIAMFVGGYCILKRLCGTS